MYKQRFLSGVFILAIAGALTACSGQSGSASFAPALPTAQSNGVQKPNPNSQGTSASGRPATDAAAATAVAALVAPVAVTVFQELEATRLA